MRAHAVVKYLVGIALGLPALGMAQYAWTDSDGRKHFSDQPPPASVPTDRILKHRINPPASTEAARSPADKTTETVTVRPSLADQEAAFRTRRAEQEEKRKKNEEAEKIAANQQRCEGIKRYEQTIQSGQRIVRTDASGNREVLNDAERANEAKLTRRVLSQC